MPTTPNPEDDVYAELEMKWEQANDALRDAYLHREELGQRFWLEISKLETEVDRLGRRLDGLRRMHRPAPVAPRPRLTPAVENHPRADTQEVPAVVPGKPEGDA